MADIPSDSELDALQRAYAGDIQRLAAEQFDAASADRVWRQVEARTGVRPGVHPGVHLDSPADGRTHNESLTRIADMTERPLEHRMRATQWTAPLRSTAAPLPSSRMLGVVMATLLIGVAGGVWLTMQGRRRDIPPAYTSYATTSGQIARITLGDGSRVTLAPNTTLGVSRAFAVSREVTLSGEAYFDVAAAGAPFLVRTDHVVTRVLGTSFDVRHYPSDVSTRVAVVTGKVTVAGQQRVILAAGSVGYVTDSTASAATVSNAQPYTAWTTGALTFRDTPASELLDVIGRWYNLEFRVADSAIVHQTVVAELAPGETRAQALQLVAKLLNANMRFSETTQGTVVVTLLAKQDERRSAPSTHTIRDPFMSHSREVGR